MKSIKPLLRNEPRVVRFSKPPIGQVPGSTLYRFFSSRPGSPYPRLPRRPVALSVQFIFVFHSEPQRLCAISPLQPLRIVHRLIREKCRNVVVRPIRMSPKRMLNIPDRVKKEMLAEHMRFIHILPEKVNFPVLRLNCDLYRSILSIT